MEEKRVKEVIIDTYALLAIVYDEVHWTKERIPGLKNMNEIIAYLKSYFKIIDLSFDDYIQAAVKNTWR